ncbi:MAG: hypothetical protein H7239_10330 [Flavobacterium sp.]|nr:hypothetical protein [Flavobacterium sp.]
MKLISMTDFVLGEKVKSILTCIEAYVLIRKYAQFLKQPLELWMFVPCDSDGNVLEYKQNEYLSSLKPYERQEYQQAKERCLFEKSKYGTGTIKEILKCSKIIEDLITCSKLDLTLTQTAIKQLGL